MKTYTHCIQRLTRTVYKDTHCKQRLTRTVYEKLHALYLKTYISAVFLRYSLSINVCNSICSEICRGQRSRSSGQYIFSLSLTGFDIINRMAKGRQNCHTLCTFLDLSHYCCADS